jgi:hypothetical protein
VSLKLVVSKMDSAGHWFDTGGCTILVGSNYGIAGLNPAPVMFSLLFFQRTNPPQRHHTSCFVDWNSSISNQPSANQRLSPNLNTQVVIMSYRVRAIVYPGGGGAVIDENWAIVEWLLVRIPWRNSEQSVLQCHFHHKESHMNSSQINSVLHGQSPAPQPHTINNHYFIKMSWSRDSRLLGFDKA